MTDYRDLMPVFEDDKNYWLNPLTHHYEELTPLRKKAIDYMKAIKSGIPLCINCIFDDDDCGWCLANNQPVDRIIKRNDKKQITHCNLFIRIRPITDFAEKRKLKITIIER